MKKQFKKIIKFLSFTRCKGCSYWDKCEKQGYCEDWG